MDNQPIQPAPPPPSPSNSSKTLLLVVGAIALMVVSAMGGYYLGANKQLQSSQTAKQYPQTSPTRAYTISPTPTPASLVIPTTDPLITANWKTYQNEKYRFEVKYPREWFAQAPNEEFCTQAAKDSSISVFSRTELDYCGFFGETIPTTDTDAAILAFDEEWKDIATILNPPKENIIIAGETAVMYRFSYQQDRPNVNAARIYFNHAGNGYLIFLKNQDPQGNHYDQLYDQILSTFKFTP